MLFCFSNFKTWVLLLILLMSLFSTLAYFFLEILIEILWSTVRGWYFYYPNTTLTTRLPTSLQRSQMFLPRVPTQCLPHSPLKLIFVNQLSSSYFCEPLFLLCIRSYIQRDHSVSVPFLTNEGPSMSQQMTCFCLFLQPIVYPLCVYICTHTYKSQLSVLFIHYIGAFIHINGHCFLVSPPPWTFHQACAWVISFYSNLPFYFITAFVLLHSTSKPFSTALQISPPFFFYNRASLMCDFYLFPLTWSIPISCLQPSLYRFLSFP